MAEKWMGEPPSSTGRYAFWAGLIIILLLSGAAWRFLLPNADDALDVSAAALRASFAERVQYAHAEFINGGRQKIQYLDIGDGASRQRLAFLMNKSGWPVDAWDAAVQMPESGNSCERLWIKTLQKDSTGVIAGVKLSAGERSEGCEFSLGRSKMLYRFDNGDIVFLQEQN